MLVSLGWVLTTVLEVFMFVFDTAVYGLAIVAINIFNALARMDFFSTQAGSEMYSDIARRLYAILGIIMVFFFAYQLVLLIINPDGDKKASSGLVKTTITSLIMIALFPTLFKYMAILQEHILIEGTITSIVLGQGASGADSDKNGKNTVMIVYLSMYHPGNGGFSSVVDSENTDANGDLLPASQDHCMSDSGATAETCDLWIQAYQDSVSGASFGGITAFTWNIFLTKTIGEEGGSTYYPVIILICGGVLIWFFASYAIDLGYRTVKLGFLQMISPVPLVMRIFPKTAKTFEKWKHELIRTYLEVFVRVFIVAFIIAIIQKLPKIMVGLFQSLGMTGSIWCVPFALVAMIFGLLKFGKELPKLAKDIFDNGSGLFNGIDWKPGIGRRFEAGKDDIVGFGKKMASYGRDFTKGVNKVFGGAVRAPLRAKRGIARAGGMIKGIGAGAAGAIESNKTKGFATVRAMIKGGAAGGKAGFQAGGLYNPADPNAKISDAIKNAGTAGSMAGRTTELFNLGKYAKSFKDEFGLQTMDAKAAKIDEIKGNISSASKEIYDRLGVTDKKTKADEFAKDELAKAREKFGEGASIVRGRAMNDDGEYSGELKAFSSLTEMEQYYKEAKQKVYEKQLQTVLGNESTRLQAEEVLSKTTQQIQENFANLVSTSNDPAMIETILSKSNGKIGRDQIELMHNFGVFGEGPEGTARYNDLIAQVTDIETKTSAKEALKIERDKLNLELDDLIRGKQSVSEELYKQMGQTVGGVTITQDVIDAKMAEFDTKIASKKSSIDTKSQEIKDLKIDNVNIDAKELANFLGKASQDFQNGSSLTAEQAASLSRVINEVGSELVKNISKNSSQINYNFAAAETSDSSGSGDSDKK